MQKIQPHIDIGKIVNRISGCIGRSDEGAVGKNSAETQVSHACILLQAEEHLLDIREKDVAGGTDGRQIFPCVVERIFMGSTVVQADGQCFLINRSNCLIRKLVLFLWKGSS